jgi:hypothetical protein
VVHFVGITVIRLRAARQWCGAGAQRIIGIMTAGFAIGAMLSHESISIGSAACALPRSPPVWRL